jgi:hypothetical protein
MSRRLADKILMGPVTYITETGVTVGGLQRMIRNWAPTAAVYGGVAVAAGLYVSGRKGGKTKGSMDLIVGNRFFAMPDFVFKNVPLYEAHDRKKIADAQPAPESE